MPEYDNTNKGVAFKNDYKKDTKHPDFKGKGNFNGVEFEFGVWKRTSEKGDFLSFSFSEPYKKPESDMWPAKSDPTDNEPINLDDIPFN